MDKNIDQAKSIKNEAIFSLMHFHSVSHVK